LPAVPDLMRHRARVIFPRRGQPYGLADGYACSPSRPWPSKWTPVSTRRRWPAVLAVEAVAVQVDARLDAAALPSPSRPWPSSWPRAPRRGGAALAVLAVDAVAVEVDARLDVATSCGPAPRRAPGARPPARRGTARRPRTSCGPAPRRAPGARSPARRGTARRPWTSCGPSPRRTPGARPPARRGPAQRRRRGRVAPPRTPGARPARRGPARRGRRGRAAAVTASRTWREAGSTWAGST
jgi:hypothetical protein